MHPLKRSRLATSIASSLAPGPIGRAAFDAFCTPAFDDDPDDPIRVSAGAARILADAARIAVASDEGALAGYRWAGPHDDAPVALLVHGWRSRASHMAAFVRPLQKAGCAVVAVDLPAHGDSPGDRAHAPAFARAVQAADAAVGGVDLVVGHSLGALGAALAVEGGPPLAAKLTPRAVALLSAPASAAEMTARFADRLALSRRATARCLGALEAMAGRPADAFRTGALLQAFEGDLLLVHDRDDPIAPASDLSEIAAAVPRAEKLRTQGLGHEGVLASPAVLKAVAAFAAKLSAA